MKKERKLEIAALLEVSRGYLNPSILMDTKLSTLEEHRNKLNQAIKDLVNDK